MNGLVGRHMDVVPPLGWNWTSDDWRMYNFFRDLDFRGGVMSGELNDRYVLLQYDKQHPALSLIIFEDIHHELGHVRNLKRLPGGGISFEQTWKMAIA